jgi:hypothetical protein
MDRRGVFKIALVFTAAVVAWAVLRREHAPYLQAIPENKVPTEAKAVATAPYEGAGTLLWTDRDYHTTTTVERLKGTVFTRIGRREHSPYYLQIKNATRLYTLANSERLEGLGEWTLLEDSVLVPDAYAPRTFDRVLMMDVEAGIYRMNNPAKGPSHPLFFDPANVQVIGYR